jgi:hypothetical protein
MFQTEMNSLYLKLHPWKLTTLQGIQVGKFMFNRSLSTKPYKSVCHPFSVVLKNEKYMYYVGHILAAESTAPKNLICFLGVFGKGNLH